MKYSSRGRTEGRRGNTIREKKRDREKEKERKREKESNRKKQRKIARGKVSVEEISMT